MALTVDEALARAVSGGLNRTLGFRLEQADADRVVVAAEVGPQLLQPFGIVHGGVYCSMVETIASIGATLWYGAQQPEGRVVGVANHTDFLRSITEGAFTGTGTPIHRGRLQQLWLVEIADAGGRPLARGEVRLQNLPPREAPHESAARA